MLRTVSSFVLGAALLCSAAPNLICAEEGERGPRPPRREGREDGPPPEGRRPPPPEGRRPPPPPPHPLQLALDTNDDGEISAEEIEGAVDALKKVDRNGDGKLSRDELRPPPPPHGRGGPPPRGEGGEGDDRPPPPRRRGPGRE